MDSAQRLVLAPRHLDALRRHAAAAYPEECCGILLGRAGRDGARVERVWPARNAHPGPRRRRYLIDPRALLAAQKRGRAQGLEIVGYYHSHPDEAAVPGEHDREHAWPATSYLILAVAAGQVGEVRGWRLGGAGAGFAPEAVELRAS